MLIFKGVDTSPQFKQTSIDTESLTFSNKGIGKGAEASPQIKQTVRKQHFGTCTFQRHVFLNGLY